MGRGRPGRVGFRSSVGTSDALGGLHEVALSLHFSSWKVRYVLSLASHRNPPPWMPTVPQGSFVCLWRPISLLSL